MLFTGLYNYFQIRKLKFYLKKKNAPQILYPAIQMTNGCNKQCRGCLRSANTSSQKTDFTSFLKYSDDLKSLSTAYIPEYQFVTGGEPTIWKSDGKDIVDVLITLSDLNIIGTIFMPTNGKVFEDMTFARNFFKRLSSGVNNKVTVGISISEYQENLGESGYIALDNLIRLSKEPGMKIYPLIMVTLSVDDDTDKRLAKLYPGVFQRVTPFAPLGDASDMTDRAPSLNLAGKKKDSLGAYLPHFKKDVIQKLQISAGEFDTLTNVEIIDKLSLHAHCGTSPFIDNKWHYCLPFKDDPRFDLCGIGEMKAGTIDNFLDNAGLLNCIRAEGLLSGIEEHKNDLTPETRDRLETLFITGAGVPVAYRGCMACKALYDVGVISELNEVVSN